MTTKKDTLATTVIAQRARAFDELFDAVVVTDLEGMVTDWNVGAQALYGWSYKEIIGQPVGVLHVPADAEGVTRDVLDAIVREGKWHGEIRMLHKNGKIGHIESMVVPVLDEAGEVTGAIGINRDISVRIHSERQLRRLAYFDHLTGIANRAQAMEKLEEAIGEAAHSGVPMAVLFIDLDHFKQVNDEVGHVLADTVLVEAAHRLEEAVRASDTVARMGGDEFLVVLNPIDEEARLGEIVDRVNAALSKPYLVGDAERLVSASVGAALFPDDGRTVDALISRADDAMYGCKRARYGQG